jgi:hypothetical protein
MTTDPHDDYQLDDLRAEYAETGGVTSGGAVWLIGQVVVLREQVQRLTAPSAVAQSAPAETALRDRIAEALRPGSRDRSGQYPEGLMRDVDAVLAVLPASVDRATVLNEAAGTIAADAALRETEGEYALAEYGYELARLIRPKELADLPAVVPAGTGEEPALRCVCGAPAVRDGDRWTHQPGTGDTCMYRPDARPRCPDCQMPHVITPGMQMACASILASIRDRDAAVPGGAGEEPAGETQTLAAMFEGLHTLLATSSRDWSTYRVDAWLWAVLCGWDCEQAEHDETCTHGAMEEMQQQHGWDDEAVAKARRYRAVVRAIEDRAAVSQPGKEH